jgi:hypothetical protein
MEPTSRYPTKQESSISNYHQAKNRGRKQPSNPNTDPKTHRHLECPKMFHVQTKISRWVVKYSAVYVESKNTFQFAQSSGCRNGKTEYAVVQSSGRVVECYRGKRTQPKRLDGASMRDPSIKRCDLSMRKGQGGTL